MLTAGCKAGKLKRRKACRAVSGSMPPSTARYRYRDPIRRSTWGAKRQVWLKNKTLHRDAAWSSHASLLVDMIRSSTGTDSALPRPKEVFFFTTSEQVHISIKDLGN
jgi:hypothetical protein